MSGGLVMGVRGDTGDLERVGMARASAATTEYRLAPPEGVEETHEPWRPYEGPLFIEGVRRNQYGITLAVPMSRMKLADTQYPGSDRGAGSSPELPLVPPRLLPASGEGVSPRVDCRM